MQRVRVGIIGAGGIAQVEHVPNLLRLKHLFDIAGVYDPSATVRGFIAELYGLPTFDTLDALLAKPLDAVVIASPDPLHHEQILAAFGRGLHVFCEKPLCYAVGDIDEVIAARDKAGRLLQVGYMKRFDPSYEQALALLPGSAKTLRHVSVEVNDPDAWPFIRHHATCRAEDVAAELIAATKAKQKQQVARAVPAALDAMSYRGFTGAYCSSLVHDVNAVHGLLDALGVPSGEISGAQLYAGGAGGQGTVRLLGGQALWTMFHLAVPGLADYRERITLYFDDAILELEFPSPYLNHQQTELWVHRSTGDRFEKTLIRASYQEAFLRELDAFWSAIVEASPVRNTVEAATRDLLLLTRIAAHAQRGSHQSKVSS